MNVRHSIIVMLGLIALLSGCASTQPMWKAADIANLSDSHVQLGHDAGVASVEIAIVRKLIDIKQRIETVVGTSPAELVISAGEEPNAFAGYSPNLGRIVGINAAMLKLIATDWDGYAAIFGHEYAHLALSHSARREERETVRQGTATLIGIVLGAVGVPMGGTIADIGTSMAARTYTRDDEREADRKGLEYMVRAGFDPNGAVRTWERMRAAGYGGSLIPFLSTHPLSSERITNLQALISAQQATQAAVVLPQEPQATADAAGKRQSARVQAESGGQGVMVTGVAYDSSRTPDMLTAVMVSDRNAVVHYLAQGVDINQTINGSTYLIGAVQVGDVEMVRFLLAQGADVNRGDRRGFTPLLHARGARPQDPAMIQALIDAGARTEQ